MSAASQNSLINIVKYIQLPVQESQKYSVENNYFIYQHS